jgi:hypothetical protein
VPPSTNTDGSPLTDLAGYTIYLSTIAGQQTIDDPTGNTLANTYTVPCQSGLDYTVDMTAYNALSIASVPSNSVTVTCP